MQASSCQSTRIHLVKVSFRNKRQIKAFKDKQILQKHISTRLVIKVNTDVNTNTGDKDIITTMKTYEPKKVQSRAEIGKRKENIIRR